MKVVTLATLATLPQARVLAASLARHQPSWELDVVLVGVDDGRIAAAEGETPLRLRSASEELDLDAERLIARHDAEELSVLLVPRLLQVYARRTAGPVLHLPPSAWVLADLEPIEAALGHGVLLTPRVSSELPEDGLRPSRRDLDRAGRMSPVAMAVDGGPRGQEFLDWWARRVEGMLGSLDGRRSGARPEDRPWLARYLELAPARFAAGVLEDPGCNVSMWNLHLRPLTSTGSHALVDGRWPLRLLDLPGFEPDRPHRLSPWATRVRVSRSDVLRELCTRYAGELQHAGWRDADRRRDVGRTLDGGLVYDDSMRALYARALALGERFGELFSDAGTRAFLSWLAAPAPEGGGNGITRYVFYRVARERPDVMRAYPELDGADGREYVNWCWAFGRDELAIPDRFMPPRHSGDAAPPPAPSNQRPERDARRAR
jgi:hypothetical protein